MEDYPLQAWLRADGSGSPSASYIYSCFILFLSYDIGARPHSIVHSTPSSRHSHIPSFPPKLSCPLHAHHHHPFLFAACFATLIFVVVSVSAWGSGCDIYRSSFFVVVYSALRSRRRQPPPVRCLRLCNPYENYKDLGSVYILSTSRIHHGLCSPINVSCEVFTLPVGKRRVSIQGFSWRASSYPVLRVGPAQRVPRADCDSIPALAHSEDVKGCTRRVVLDIVLLKQVLSFVITVAGCNSCLPRMMPDVCAR